jgi:hypothetical protein
LICIWLWYNCDMTPELLEKKRAVWKQNMEKAKGTRFRKSMMAKGFAKDYIDALMSGKKINKQELAVRHGYSVSSALAQKPMKTDVFKEEVTSVLDRLEIIRQKSLKALESKDHSKEKYRDLIEGVDKLTRNHRLLSEKSTDNVANNMIVYGSDDFLAMQLSKDGSIEPDTKK